MSAKFIAILIVFGYSTTLYSQDIDKIINAKEVERIERILSSDEMGGRKPNTPGIEKAAAFISGEFKKAGLQPINGSYLQEFTIPGTSVKISGSMLGKPVIESEVVMFSTKDSFSVDNRTDFNTLIVGPADTLTAAIRKLRTLKGNYLLMVDTTHAGIFNRYRNYRGTPEGLTIVMILGKELPGSFNLNSIRQTTRVPLRNVVGIIPGKSRKNEYVIFSGHYDHLGITKPDQNGDSIYNGANDDAAGITAVIMLANYFAKAANNERTLIFAAFTAEESGGFGSKYFSEQYKPETVMAMFNIEMIGTESKWGRNSAYITGYEKTSMGEILKKNLAGSKFIFHPDPYPEQNLFYRSDNLTLARQGVPAHTISTAKMADEKTYHTVDDEIETLDMNNMAEIIKAIAISSRTIVAGKDTPSRVDSKKLP